MVNKCFLASLLVVCQVCYAGWSVGDEQQLRSRFDKKCIQRIGLRLGPDRCPLPDNETVKLPLSSATQRFILEERGCQRCLR